MPRKTCCIDDTLLWDEITESDFWHTLDYIAHCAMNGIVFNPDKFLFARDEVEFAGFLITTDGVKPTKKWQKPFSTPYLPQTSQGQFLVWTRRLGLVRILTSQG